MKKINKLGCLVWVVALPLIMFSCTIGGGRTEITPDMKAELGAEVYIQSLVEEAIGTETNMGIKKIGSVSVNPGEYILLILQANENVTSGAMLGKMRLETLKICELLVRNGETDYINIIVSYCSDLTDIYGKVSTEMVYTATMPVSEMVKINYDNFITDDFPLVVQEGLHPIFRGY